MSEQEADVIKFVVGFSMVCGARSYALHRGYRGAFWSFWSGEGASPPETPRRK